MGIENVEELKPEVRVALKSGNATEMGKQYRELINAHGIERARSIWKDYCDRLNAEDLDGT